MGQCHSWGFSLVRIKHLAGILLFSTYCTHRRQASIIQHSNLFKPRTPSTASTAAPRLYSALGIIFKIWLAFARYEIFLCALPTALWIYFAPGWFLAAMVYYGISGFIGTMVFLALGIIMKIYWE